MEATIGTKVDLRLPVSPATRVATNKGVPLLQSGGRDPVTKQLRRLVERLTIQETVTAQPDPDSRPPCRLLHVVAFDHQQVAHVRSAELLAQFGNPTSETLHVAFCPMVFGNRGAEWVQSADTLQNAYFGADMLTCGEMRDAIPPGATLVRGPTTGGRP